MKVCVRVCVCVQDKLRALRYEEARNSHFNLLYCWLHVEADKLRLEILKVPAKRRENIRARTLVLCMCV